MRATSYSRHFKVSTLVVINIDSCMQKLKKTSKNLMGVDHEGTQWKQILLVTHSHAPIIFNRGFTE